MRNIIITTLLLLSACDAAKIRQKLELQSLSTHELIDKLADKHGIDPLFLHAMIQTESSYNEDAERFEPHVKAKYFPTKPDYYSTSSGLMQVVYGFHKDRCGLTSFKDLQDSRVNIECGITYFLYCHERYETLHDALSCYNGDWSGEYAERVLSKYKRM